MMKTHTIQEEEEEKGEKICEQRIKFSQKIKKKGGKGQRSNVMKLLPSQQFQLYDIYMLHGFIVFFLFFAENERFGVSCNNKKKRRDEKKKKKEATGLSWNIIKIYCRNMQQNP